MNPLIYANTSNDNTYLRAVRQLDDLAILLLESFSHKDSVFLLLNRSKFSPCNDYPGPSKADMHIFPLDSIHFDGCCDLHLRVSSKPILEVTMVYTSEPSSDSLKETL